MHLLYNVLLYTHLNTTAELVMRGPNMDYCAFENTTLAMEQLIDMMRDAQEEGITEFFNGMSRT